MTIENLEIKCEELQKKIDDLIAQARRQSAASPSMNIIQQQSDDWETSKTQGGSEKQVSAIVCLFIHGQTTQCFVILEWVIS